MDELIPLANAALARLPEGVGRPLYDRAALTPGIVHIGLGNFHRAHQAWYLHRLLSMGLAQDWAIIGASVRHQDAAQRQKLLDQDCLTTLIGLDPAGPSAEVTGAMIGYLPIQPDNAALVAQMADPAIRIVALTVTEGGYFLDEATGAFDLDHPDIRHDIAHPDSPRTAFGAMVAALRARRAAGQGAFTGLSCDNLQGNGRILRAAVVGLARAMDPDLADWIETHARFPNAMVDCIVPATGPAEIAMAADLGIADQVPVTHESFRQWVVEDDFAAGRPDWDRVGVTFSDDVHGYEAMKIRILNAGHQVLANAGEILSIDTIPQCMAQPAIRALFDKVQTAEIAPHVRDVPDMTASDYVDLVSWRFANPAVSDTTRRVAFDGSARHAGFVLPSVRAGLAAGTPVEGLALVEALWARMCEGTREDGSVIAPNDPHWARLAQTASAARDRPAHWLEQNACYSDLPDAARFGAAFQHWLRNIWSDGAEAAMAAYAAR